MAEDLTRLWGNFSLDEGETTELEIQPRLVVNQVARGKCCLVGKLIADHFVGKDVIKRSLIKGWRLSEQVAFKVLGDNLFLLEFEKEEDKIRVFKGRPWFFEESIFAIEDFDGLSSPAEVVFEKVAFWVRMLNLPLACMGKEVGLQIGATMGEVEEVDTDEDGVGWGKFLRVRIRLDVTKPLARGRMIRLLGKQVLITFQYEKLPWYCLDCGRISHGNGGCDQKSGVRDKGSEKQYGTWLRVPPPRRRGNQSKFRQNSWKEGGRDSVSRSGTEVRRNWSGGSRTCEEGSDEPVSWPRNTPAPAEAVDKGKKPVGEEMSVMEEEGSNEERGNSGETNGAFIGRFQTPVESSAIKEKNMEDFNEEQSRNKGAFNGRFQTTVEDPAVKEKNMKDFNEEQSMERNNGAFNEEQRLEMNVLQAVSELKLKGEGAGGNKESINAGDVVLKKKETLKSNLQPPGKVQTREEPNINVGGKISNVEAQKKGAEHAHVALRWKRRARDGQQRTTVIMQNPLTGKRKTGRVGGTDNEETSMKWGRRVKYNGEITKLRRDENEEVKNGSGVAGSGSQPRRPA
jgi:hypothetical protein